MPFLGITHINTPISGYDGMLGLGPKSSFLTNLSALKTFSPNVSLFFGSQLPGSTAKSSATFGCPIPPTVADGTKFDGEFHDIASYSDMWLIQAT